jgi:hypothetical protein
MDETSWETWTWKDDIIEMDRKGAGLVDRNQLAQDTAHLLAIVYTAQTIGFHNSQLTSQSGRNLNQCTHESL